MFSNVGNSLSGHVTGVKTVSRPIGRYFHSGPDRVAKATAHLAVTTFSVMSSHKRLNNLPISRSILEQVGVSDSLDCDVISVCSPCEEVTAHKSQSCCRRSALDLTGFLRMGPLETLI